MSRPFPCATSDSRARPIRASSPSAAGNVVVVTKDQDFVRLLEHRGPPPRVIWITCGNTSNERMKQVLAAALPAALELLRAGEPLVEISDAR